MVKLDKIYISEKPNKDCSFRHDKKNKKRPCNIRPFKIQATTGNCSQQVREAIRFLEQKHIFRKNIRDCGVKAMFHLQLWIDLKHLEEVQNHEP